MCIESDIHPYHAYSVQYVAIAVRHDSHGYKETPKQEEKDEGGVIWVLGGPVQGATELVNFQRVAVPAQKRCARPGNGIQPDVRDGPPGPGEVNDLGVHHSDVSLVC